MIATMIRVFVLSTDHNARSLWLFLQNNWRAMADDGKPLSVTVQEHKEKRSSDQNRRYWALLNEIAAGAWIGGRRYGADAWHEFFKAKMIGLEEIPDGRSVGISTTTLSVAEFAEYMTKVEAYAVDEFGIEIDG